MATASGIRDCRVVLSNHDRSEPAWQDPAYLGEVIYDAMEADALAPFVTGMWRLFGIDPAAGAG